MSEAAGLLFISVQGLSKSIARLEGELGRQLFVRSNRGISPTPYARKLYPQAQAVVSLVSSMQSGLERAGEPDMLSLVTTSGYLFTLGTSLMDDFEADNPGMRIEAEEAVDGDVVRRVVDDYADCGCVSGAVDFALLDASLLYRHPFVAVVNRQDPLAVHESLSYDDLDGIVVTLMAPGFSAVARLADRRPVVLLGFAGIR